MENPTILFFCIGENPVPPSVCFSCVSITFTLPPHSQHLWHQMCVDCFLTTYNSLQHWLGVWQFNSILTLLPGDSTIFHRLRAQPHKTVLSVPSDTNHKSRWLPVLQNHRLEIWGSHDPNLGFDCYLGARNSEKLFTYCFQSVMKEHRWTSRWKRFESKVCEKGRRASMSSPETSLSQHLNLFTDLENSFGVFIETLHMHNWLNNWPLLTNSICSPHPHANSLIR